MAVFLWAFAAATDMKRPVIALRPIPGGLALSLPVFRVGFLLDGFFGSMALWV